MGETCIEQKFWVGELETSTALFSWFITILIKQQGRKEKKKVYDCHCEIHFPFTSFITFEEWLNILRCYCSRYPPISPNCVSVYFKMQSQRTCHSDQFKIRYTNKTARVKPHKHKEPGGVLIKFDQICRWNPPFILGTR